MWMNAGAALCALLFAVLGFYLTLIAKFYRVKFGRGPKAGWMGVGLAATVAGMLLRMDVFGSMPIWISAALMCAGAVIFSGLAYSLYLSMMHARPRVET